MENLEEMYKSYFNYKCVMAVIYSENVEECLKELEPNYLLNTFCTTLKNLLQDESLNYKIDEHAKKNIYILVQYILSHFKVKECEEAFYEEYNEIVRLVNCIKMNPEKFYKEEMKKRYGHLLPLIHLPLAPPNQEARELLYNSISLDYQIFNIITLSDEDFDEVCKTLNESEGYIISIKALLDEIPALFYSKPIREKLLRPLEANKRKREAGYNIGLDEDAYYANGQVLKKILRIERRCRNDE